MKNAQIYPLKNAKSLIFEWPALQRFGISESTLPPGSEVRFRPATMWELLCFFRPHLSVG